jgi:hypothetical protein
MNDNDSMLLEDDWAIKHAREILKEVELAEENTYPDEIVKRVSQSLRQERENTRLEASAMYKKIEWPSDGEIKWEASRQEGDKSFGFITGCEWLITYINRKRVNK